MWIAVALCAIIFWLAIFFTFFQSDEEALRARLPKRDGKLPPLGVWLRVEEHADGGYDEERFVLEGRRLLRQVRKRDATGEIVEVLGEERVRR
jgi:hypothetical protein